MWTQIEALISDFIQVPTYHLYLEGFLFLWILWLLVRRFYQKRGQKRNEIKLTEKEEEELLAEWKPEPLVPEFTDKYEEPPLIEGKVGKFVTVDGIKCLNFASHNYLGFSGNQNRFNRIISCSLCVIITYIIITTY